MHKRLGQKFNLLTITEIITDTPTMCVCKCDCGKITKVIQLRNVLSGNTRSCGCARHKRKEWTGQKFGRLTAMRFSHMKHEASYWLFRCDCGTEKVICSNNVVRGGTRSCGCLRNDTDRRQPRKAKLKHGKCGTKVYKAWASMKYRCLNENSRSYARYGGRGIKICDRWLDSFENFYADMGDPPSKQHSIDRKDNDGDYEPSNCIWATKKGQSNNRRVTIFLTIGDKRQSLAHWTEEFGLNYRKTWRRVKAGWSIEEALELVPHSPLSP